MEGNGQVSHIEKSIAIQRQHPPIIPNTGESEAQRQEGLSGLQSELKNSMYNLLRPSLSSCQKVTKGMETEVSVPSTFPASTRFPWP